MGMLGAVWWMKRCTDGGKRLRCLERDWSLEGAEELSHTSIDCYALVESLDVADMVV